MSTQSLSRSLLLATFGATIIAIPGLANAATLTHRSKVNIVDLTVKDIQLGLATGEFTAADLTESFLARIEIYEPVYNAFTVLNSDALATAKLLDLEYQVSGPRSPLHGVPIVIKDAVDIAGFPTTAGYSGFSSTVGGIDLIPETNAPLVTALIEAGAVILGKTNLPAFAASGTNANTSYAGPTFNAYDLNLAPGGSSSGSATAVAASFAVMGIAEETGGSIQNPAGAQSLVGIKPTFGLVPNTGVFPLAGSTRDVLGPLTKTVYDAAVTLDILAGPNLGDPKTAIAEGKLPAGGYVSALSDTALEGKRLGLFGPGFKNVELTPETQTLYAQAIQDLLGQGATVVEDPFTGSNFASLSPVSGFDSRGLETLAYDLDQYLRRLGPSAAINSFEEVEEVLGINLFAPGQPLSFIGSLPNAEEYLANPSFLPIEDFLEVRESFLSIFLEVLDSNNLDGLAFPQMYAPVPSLFGGGGYSATTVSEINILGVPGITVPAGYYENGSPFSLIFLGAPFSEAELLGYAYDYEQATLLRVAPNLVTPPETVPEPSSLLGLAALSALGWSNRRRFMMSRKHSKMRSLEPYETGVLGQA